MPLDSAEEVRQAAAAGFDLIEFRAPKIAWWLEREALDDIRRQIDAPGIRPLSINAIEQANTRPPDGRRALLDECERMAGWAAALGCPYVIAVAGLLDEPQPEEDVRARTVDALAALADIAERHDVRLGFEFLGFRNCSVNSLQSALKIVRRVKRPSVGLVLDTFHFFLSGEPVDALQEIQSGELFILHVNDAENRPRTELADEHRLLPGEGVIPLRQIWDTLQQRVLIGHASLELFHPQHWQEPPEQFLPRALASLRTAFPG